MMEHRLSRNTGFSLPCPVAPFGRSGLLVARENKGPSVLVLIPVEKRILCHRRKRVGKRCFSIFYQWLTTDPTRN